VTAARHSLAAHRRGLWRGVASLVLVAAGLAAAVVLTRGPAVAAGPTVAVLPYPGGGTQTWAWTPSCYLVPQNASACAKSDPNLAHAQLDGDIWNLGVSGTGAGSVDMALGGSGGLEIRGKLPSAPPCTATNCLAPSANTWVRGYPSVVYGTGQCSNGTSPPPSPALPLPMKVASLPADLIGTTTYSSQAVQVTYDIAYDMWLNPSSTKTPCHTDGTLEVMVWTGYDQRALLPGSMEAETATVPFAIDGTGHPGTNAWSVFTSNIFSDGQTAPWGGTIWFVLDQADARGTGTVSVDLSAVFSAVGTLLTERYAWPDFAGNYWLETVPFGIEFGPASGSSAGTGPSDFSLRISSYCLAVRPVPASATC
jgi:hypothetical protein